MSADGFNALMLVTCRFSKRITLIEGIDSWSAKQWAYTFLKHLDLIDLGLPGKLVTDRDPKFLGAFCTALFTKLGVKLLYSTAYYPQTDGSSKHTNQTVEIARCFFLHALDDPSSWHEVLPRIQSILNNISSSNTGKIPNKIAYRFLPKTPLDSISFSSLPDTFVAWADVADAISFALANRKAHYNRKHQSQFMKVRNWAMLKLHKGYLIPSSIEVTKKLPQRYVGLFLIVESVGRLAYKLEVPND